MLANNRENVTQLGTSREHAGLKRTEPVAGAAVGTDLVIGIADEADEELFRQELGRAPIQMKINAALILGRVVDEIIGKPRNCGKLMPCCGMK